METLRLNLLVRQIINQHRHHEAPESIAVTTEILPYYITLDEYSESGCYRGQSIFNFFNSPFSFFV